MPLQLSTDCGSETTLVYALGNALRYVLSFVNPRLSSYFHYSEIFHPDFDTDVVPAHVYLRSVHNISIERSWLRLRCEVGDNAVIVFQQGEADGFYKPHDKDH